MMKIPFQSSKFKKVRESGLTTGMTSEERWTAWIKAGLDRTPKERFLCMAELMKVHFVEINGKCYKQYF